jgi:hypothetical protein
MVIPNADPIWEAIEDSRPEVETVSAIVDRASMRQGLKQSGELFIEFFLGDELTFPVPKFHVEVWELLTNTALQRVMLAIPRDHAKTTLSKLCVVWYFLFTNHRFCVYLSNTNSRAKDACRDIIGFLKSDNFRTIFGDIRVIKDSETESIWIFELPLGDGKHKKCILRAVGANQTMRGINVDNQRPDIAIVDDLEDNENTESETLQKKLDKWVFGPFLKALAKQKKIIWLGNMLQKTSLLARMSLDKRWNPVVFGCLVKNELTGGIVPLWPDRWPLEELIEDFAEYRQMGLIETWMCEMMNMPGHGKNGFTAEMIYMQPRPETDEVKAAFLILDPAFGEKEVNDDSSITVHVIRDMDGLPMVAEDVTGKLTEAELFETMLRLARKWNAFVWGIESVAAQRVLITLFNTYMALNQIPNHIEMIPLISGKGDPKIARIRGFMSMMGKKEYAIADDMLTFVTQALNYNMSKKSNVDDLLDSSAYGPQMVGNYLSLIMASTSGYTDEELLAQAAIQSGTEICSV